MANAKRRECLLLLFFIFLISIPNYCPKLIKTCDKSFIFSKHGNLRRNICRKDLVNFKDWDFEETSLLLHGFPLDPETRNYVRQVRRSVFSYVKPSPLKTMPKLVAVSSDALSEILDINPESVDVRISPSQHEGFLRFVSGAEVTLRSVPLAHRYGGHQFGEWADQLGDGRAVTLGEYVNRKGEKWELQLKGSGKTPYSRRGDGRAVLRSSVREFLASEAMHYLGIPTSRAAGLVVSQDPVWRDQFYDGHPVQEKAAIVLRIAKSWFRIGSLEILTMSGETDLLRQVVDFVIQHHYSEISQSAQKYLEFFSRMVSMTADMIARWQAAGFAHGVCNTDNFSLLSITIDYGPFGFLDEYNTIRTMKADIATEISQALDITTFKNYWQPWHHYLIQIGLIKFSRVTLRNSTHGKRKMMEVTRTDFTMTFRELSSLTSNEIELNRIPSEAWALRKLSKHHYWKNWLEIYRHRLKGNEEQDDDEKRNRRMKAVNPRYVLRNWMAQHAIDKAEKDDFSEVNKLLRVLQRPFDLQEEAEASGYASPPPPWASQLRVSCSS